MKSILKIVAIVVALLLVVAIALPFVINVNRFRPQIESQLTTALGRQVNMGNLSLSILSGSVVANNITIADDPAFGKSAFRDREVLEGGRGDYCRSFSPRS